MNKQELDALTKHESTWEEFVAIEAFYMSAPDMTKKKAARLWTKLYGKAAKERETAPVTDTELLVAIRDNLRMGFIPECFTATIRGRLFGFKRGNHRPFARFSTVTITQIESVDIAHGTSVERRVGIAEIVDNGVSVGGTIRRTV